MIAGYNDYLTYEEVKKYSKSCEFSGYHKVVPGATPVEKAFTVYCYLLDRLCDFEHDDDKYVEKLGLDTPQLRAAYNSGKVVMAQEFVDSICQKYLNGYENRIDYSWEDFDLLCGNYQTAKGFLEEDEEHDYMPAALCYSAYKLGFDPKVKNFDFFMKDLVVKNMKEIPPVKNKDVMKSIDAKLADKTL